jgi:hypothetical protein
MDVLTPAGQQTVKDELEAVHIWNQHYPELVYCHTPKDRESPVDAVLTKSFRVCGVVETKCRYDMTVDQFFNERKGLWLVTFDKIINARQVALSLGVSLIGFLYIVQDKTLLAKKITDSHGKFLIDMSISNTTTQMTVNGGSIVRSNAFVDMTGCQVYKGAHDMNYKGS